MTDAAIQERETPDSGGNRCADNQAHITNEAAVSQRNAPLSLQEKLDRISRDRDILAVRRELARHGLSEGDTVLRIGDGTVGTVVIVASTGLPTTAVRLESGDELPLDFDQWSRARR